MNIDQMQQVCLVLVARFTSTQLLLFALATGNSNHYDDPFLFTLLYFWSIFELASSIPHLRSVLDTHAPLSVPHNASTAVTVCSCHISDSRGLTSRSHAVANDPTAPLPYQFHRQPGAREHNYNSLRIRLRFRRRITQHPTIL